MKKETTDNKSENPDWDVIIDELKVIDDYIEEGILAIDPAKPLAVISWRLHLMYMDDEYKLSRWPWSWLNQIGLVDRDARYRRLMKSVLMYINMMRGNLKNAHINRLIFEGVERAEAELAAEEEYGVYDGALHFIISGTDEEPFLLGTYDSDVVAFLSPEEEQNKD